MKKKRSDASAPPDSEVFVETRERVDGREYKTGSEVIKNKIQKIKEKISTTEDPSGELLSHGKKHGPYWLQGRCAKATKGCGSSTNTYVQELAGKIKENLATEIEASVSKKVQEVVEKKVQEKMSMVLKKLAYTNPGITINLEEFYPTSDHDENFTPLSGGSTF
ncbi:uncharacterized protein LOC141668508 isoform X2 [Apium graveolens]|uniref:uncharacterized protein LOC141668508 isoform X2 n=1 Tax=Apium graveolens TaxID=4045 RepID=UPI003D7B5B32